MTRKKVKLAFITNDSSRKATFKKRKKGLMKKVNELSTLCGITACAIIYSPYDTNPEVWPSNAGVQRVISEFRTLPEMDQHKKMVDQETFLRQRIAKASDHLKRQRKENRELEMTEVMYQCLVGNMGMFHLNIMDLNDLGYLIEQNLKDINRRQEILRSNGMEIGESSNADATDEAVPETVGTLAIVAAPTVPTGALTEVGSASSFAAITNFFHPNQHQMQHQQQYQQQNQHHQLLQQQQFRHPGAPHGGFFDQPRNQIQNQNQNQNQNHQQWLMEMMNHPEQMSYVAEQMGYPFMDDNHQNHNQHQHHHHQQQQQQQQQQVPGDSSTTPTAASSSNILPVTGPNVTNNIWFH